MIKTLYRISALFVLYALLSACASSPPEKKPEVLELAYKSLGKGVANYSDSNYSGAQKHFNDALSIFRSVDHREGTASSCLNLAKVQLANNRIDSAADYLMIAEKIINESSLNNLQDHLAITKSSLELSKNNYVEAKKLLGSLINSKQDNPFRLAALQNSIRIAIAEKKTDDAKNLAAEFAALITKLNQSKTIYQARLYRFQAELDASAESGQKYEQALTIYRKHTHKPGLASTLYEWGNKLLTQNKPEEAKEKLLRALYIRQTINDVSGSLNILASLNKIYITLSAEEMAQQTIVWKEKLQADDFSQWEKFAETFDTFPTLK